MLIFEQRASTVLYNYLIANQFSGIFLLPANVCPIVPITFLKAKIPFEMVDISSFTLAMDEELVHEKLKVGKDHISGLLFVHTYGDITPFTSFFQSIKKNFPSIKIVDDRCLCTPDFSDTARNPADLVLYSTGYGKMVDVGTGGFGRLKDTELYRASDLPFKDSDLAAIENQYKFAVLNQTLFTYCDCNWLNTSKFVNPDEYADLVNASKKEVMAHKDLINSIYGNMLPQEIQLPRKFQNWRFSIRVPKKQILLNKIFNQGLFASSHYASLGGIFTPGHFPQAELIHASIVNLFNDHHFSIDQATRTVDIIKDHLDKFGKELNVQN